MNAKQDRTQRIVQAIVRTLIKEYLPMDVVDKLLTDTRLAINSGYDQVGLSPAAAESMTASFLGTLEIPKS